MPLGRNNPLPIRNNNQPQSTPNKNNQSFNGINQFQISSKKIDHLKSNRIIMIQAGKRVGIFMKRKLQETKLRRHHVLKETGISLHKMYIKKQNNVSLKTVLRLADYFNCSTDEVLGRTSFINPENRIYESVTSEEVINKIRNFMIIKVDESGKDIPKFIKSCGLKVSNLNNFITEDRDIYCNNILSIADHFNISIDELIGRSGSPSLILNDETKTVESIMELYRFKYLSQKLTKEDAARLKRARQSIKHYCKSKMKLINKPKKRK